MKSAVTTVVTAFILGIVAFWFHWDLLRRQADYSTFLNANALYLEATDFGFASSPEFWFFLVASNFLAYGVAGALGYAVGNNLKGVVLGAACLQLLEVLLRYLPRIPEATWEYHLGFSVQACIAVGSASLEGRLLRKRRGEPGAV